MKFGIRSIESIKFFDISTGEELKDYREKEPIKEKIDFNTPILKLVKDCVPDYELLNHPLIKENSVYYGGVYDKFKWTNSLDSLDELTLWKIFAIIKATDAINYNYRWNRILHEEYIKGKNIGKE